GAADDLNAAAGPRVRREGQDAGDVVLLDLPGERRIELADEAAREREPHTLQREVVDSVDAEREPVRDVLRVGPGDGQRDRGFRDVFLNTARIPRRLARQHGEREGANSPECG